MNYYNEFDPKAAAWLRELISQKLIPNGIVDTRSITEVRPDDLREFTQCHFFAGIGGWSYALQLAGWPEDRPVWTGSCPCQPFSTAGKGLGEDDERHLWPVFFGLIKECRPEFVIGEQVARAVSKGWTDQVKNDLETQGYSFGEAVLGAFSAGADHHRKRCYWMAHAVEDGRNGKGIPQRERESFLCSTGSGHIPPWASLPVPGDAKNFRDVLLLPDGIPGDMGIIGAFGNAIVPQVAAQFIQAYLEATEMINIKKKEGA